VIGLGWMALALIEDLAGTSGLVVGGHLALRFTIVDNVLHWAVGLAGLAAFWSGRAASRRYDGVVGILAVALAALGLVARSPMGTVLGFPGKLPVAYVGVYLVTAFIGLYTGFASRPVRSHA
jgi:hypothetical protein